MLLLMLLLLISKLTINLILFDKVKATSVVAMGTDVTVDSYTATLDIFSVDLIAVIGSISSTIETVTTAANTIHSVTDAQMGHRMFSIQADATVVMGEFKESPKLVVEGIQSFFGDVRFHLVTKCR